MRAVVVYLASRRRGRASPMTEVLSPKMPSVLARADGVIE